MPSRPLIIVDITAPGRDGMLAEFGSDTRAVQRTFTRHDGNEFDFMFVENKGNGRYTVADLTGYTIQSALGDTDEPPTDGTFDLAFNGDTTGLTGLVYNISGSALQTAINANPAVSPQSVSVVQFDNSYQITFNATGAQGDFTSVATSLIPECYASLTRVQEGGVGVKEIWWLRLVQKPLGFTDTFTPGSSGSASVEVLQAGTDSLFEVQRIKLNITPQAGSIIVNAATRQEIRIACAADVAGSLNETGFIIEDSDETVAPWWDHGGGGTAPAEVSAAGRQIAITGGTNGMSAAAAATLLAAALDGDSEFEASAAGNIVTVRQAVAGQRIDATDVGTGFTFETTQDGLQATATINVDASAGEVAGALGDIANITKSDVYQWDVTFKVPGDQDAITVDATALFQTVYTASLSLANQQTFRRFASEDPGTDEITVPWEISITPPAGLPITVYRQDHQILRDVITNDVTASNPLPESITALWAHNTIVVDLEYGSDSTGTRERLDKPFATLEAAKAAASFNDTIIVRNGSYSVSTSIAGDGIHYRFEGDANVEFTGDYTTGGLFDDGGNAMAFTVEGGRFIVNQGGSQGGPILKLANSSSNVRFKAYSASGDAFEGLFQQSNGASDIEVDSTDATAAPVFRWSGGNMKIRGGIHTGATIDGTIFITGTTAGRLDILNGPRIISGAAGEPIAYDSGVTDKTVVLHAGYTLVSGAATSISAPSAQTVKNYGGVMNAALDSDITFSPNAGYTVDTLVS